MTHQAIFQEYRLKQDQELRFEVKPLSKGVCMKLKSGTAEVFGRELVKGISHEFKAGANVAVFTWFGCVVSMKGETEMLYVAKETPMVMYSNCHAAFEVMRGAADMYNRRGPIAMVVGPKNVGKSTMSKILLNYALRMGRKPIFVDLDVEQGHISMPGSIGAMLIESPFSEDVFPPEALVYHYGHESSSSNPALLNLMVKQLARKVIERVEVHRKARSSGIIINTCGWTRGEGYKHLLSSAKEFEVDVVLVLDQERLYSELLRDMPKSTTVVYLPKSGGVVERSESVRTATKDHRIREYFYGTPKNPVYPHSFTVEYSQVKIFRIEALVLPESCLPIENLLVPLSPDHSLQNRILAISFAGSECNILSSNVGGFVCVTNVDPSRQTLTLLSPCPRPLPNHLLVLSDLQFLDNN